MYIQHGSVQHVQNERPHTILSHCLIKCVKVILYAPGPKGSAAFASLRDFNHKIYISPAEC